MTHGLTHNLIPGLTHGLTLGPIPGQELSSGGGGLGGRPPAREITPAPHSGPRQEPYPSPPAPAGNGRPGRRAPGPSPPHPGVP